MSKKIKVNDRVRIIPTGEYGTVKGRDVIPQSDNRVKVEYIVKVGDGFSNWKSYTRNEIERVDNVEKEEPRVYTKVYDVVDGYKITMYAKVENCQPYWSTRHCRRLLIGYSIYNPEDKYDEALGIRIARHRAYNCPFTNAVSEFSGEFNAVTVMAIMDVKADYIKNNFDKFIGREQRLRKRDVIDVEYEIVD